MSSGEKFSGNFFLAVCGRRSSRPTGEFRVDGSRRPGQFEAIFSVRSGTGRYVAGPYLGLDASYQGRGGQLGNRLSTSSLDGHRGSSQRLGGLAASGFQRTDGVETGLCRWRPHMPQRPARAREASWATMSIREQKTPLRSINVQNNSFAARSGFVCGALGSRSELESEVRGAAAGW